MALVNSDNCRARLGGMVAFEDVIARLSKAAAEQDYERPWTAYQTVHGVIGNISFITLHENWQDLAQQAPPATIFQDLFGPEQGRTLFAEATACLDEMESIAAGGETTRNAVSGGVLAFLEHPDELARLQADPGLLDPAVEEILRWSTPIIHFCRSAREDTELRGQTVRAGESVVLFYPSANRDEAVFEEPERFRIDREPNRHLAFGVGEHFCLGAHLARLQLRAIFREWSTRIRDAELTGPLERLRLGVVGGIKHLPLRYRMQASGARAE